MTSNTVAVIPRSSVPLAIEFQIDSLFSLPFLVLGIALAAWTATQLASGVAMSKGMDRVERRQEPTTYWFIIISQLVIASLLIAQFFGLGPLHLDGAV